VSKKMISIRLPRKTWEIIELWIRGAALFPPAREYMYELHTALVEALDERR
jgi:hypothetical protein